MSDEGQRVRVQSYVPESQRDVWLEEADELEMSQAEYVRTMIQAGRRSFDLDGTGVTDDDSGNPEDTGSPDATPGVDAMKTRILETVAREGAADWDTLLADVTEDVEDRLEDAVNELLSEGRIEHRPREGAYVEGDDGR